jgi:hypothetical protein
MGRKVRGEFTISSREQSLGQPPGRVTGYRYVAAALGSYVTYRWRQKDKFEEGCGFPTIGAQIRTIPSNFL